MDSNGDSAISEKYSSTNNSNDRIHDHCSQCFTIKCKVIDDCVIINCRFSCGSKMHSCKQPEHNLICTKKPTHCINFLYGCLYVGPRISMLSHLEVCPASIVQCTRTWNRVPLYSKVHSYSVSFKQINPPVHNDDVSMRLTLHDQQQVIERYKQILTKGKIHLAAKEGRTQLSKHSIDSLKQLLTGKSSECAPAKMSETLHGSVYFESAPYETHNEATEEYLLQAKRAIIGEEPFPGDENSQVSLSAPLLWPNKLGLRMGIEWLPSFQPRSTSYRFTCCQIIRRDQFAHHAKMIHDVIAGHLEGWLIHRCPLAHYGCGFSEERLSPPPPLSKFIFSDSNGCVGVTSRQPLIGKRSPRSILRFPLELLELIIGMLDNLAYRNLALTCKRLRSICKELVYRKGIVEMKWEKRQYDNHQTSWQIKNRVRYFTTSFKSTNKLKWNERPSGQLTIGEHLKSCPFYQTMVKTEPFKLLDVVPDEQVDE